MVERLSLPGFLNYWEPAVAKCLKERIKITSAASTGGKDIRRKTFYSHLLSAEKFFFKKKKLQNKLF
jgi:hypothetical protein